MTKLTNIFLLLCTISALLFTACSSNPCDDIMLPPGLSCDDGQVFSTCTTTCSAGQALTTECTCVNIAMPCMNTCPTGEVLAADCSCVEPAMPCDNTCEDGQVQLASCDCVEDNQPIGQVTVMGFINEDASWTKNNVYVLNGKVVVADGATLTIEAGTVIKGATGEGTLSSALIVAQGGQILAMGTAEEPIIMTSILDNLQPGDITSPNLDENESGLWGGLIVLGKAPISVDGDSETSIIEGLPVDDGIGIYGGSDPLDNSGTITYVSIRHGGAVIGADNEINGLTLGGVGNGTTIDHIEVIANKDDGVEWFGGTVDCSNILVFAADDDAIDIDQSYTGTIENVVVIAFGGTDHGLEIDGPEGSYVGSFTLENVTVKGKDDELANIRDGAIGEISNAYFFGFEAAPSDLVDDPENPGTQIASGEGDFKFSGDNTKATYAAGELRFSGFEFASSVGAPVAEVFCDFTPEDQAAISEVAEGANVGGADTTVFGWTSASRTGVLDF